MLSAEDIQKNWGTHLKLVDVYISDRKDAVLAMLESLSETIIMSPASPKVWHHNAFPGGYLDHVNRVVRFAFKQMELYKELGGTVNFTEEELVFSALFHDLGKIGDGEKDNYIVQTDSWRQSKLGEAYTFNPDLDFMLASDRSLFMLQKYGIRVNTTEYLAIKTHDGMYQDSNKPYLISNTPDSRFKSNLPYILHTADFLATKVEIDRWEASPESKKTSEKPKKSHKGMSSLKGSQGMTNMLKSI